MRVRGNFVFPSFRKDTTRTAILVVQLGSDAVRGHELFAVRIKGERPVPVD